MKPIIILAIAAVAAGAMGTGFLNNTNGIDLWIQQFGVGEGDISTPVSHATVEFVINRSGPPGGPFDNIIEYCKLTFDKPLQQGAEIFCKLTDWEGLIVGEGKATLQAYLSTGNLVMVPILDGVNNVLVIKDVVIVVQDQSFSESLAETIAP